MLKRIMIILSFAAVSLLSLFLQPQQPYDIPDGGDEPVCERIISDYDDIMRAVESDSGIDWRMLSAIAHTESRFRADAVSDRGAVGLMQIMPSIGRHFGIPDELLGDPRTNVWVGAMLLCEIDSMVGLPKGLAERDRWGIILACYNGGLGHVSDARRLAKAYGENKNSWITVSHYLRLKNDPEYYENEVVSYGRFTGGRSTTAYVRDVLNCYARYCRLTEPATAD